MQTIPQHFRVKWPFRDLDGRPYEKDTILCGAGDWPAIKRTIKDRKQWSTVRAGVWIIAQGPPFGPAIDFALRNRGRDNVLTLGK